MAKRKHDRPPRFVDTVRYGSQLATLKRNYPKRWDRLVDLAKKQGVSVQTLASGAPPELRPKSPAALRDEARKTIAAAYKPIEAQLDRRGRANAALEEKRAADAAAYRQWLDGERSLLASQGAAADSAMALTSQKIHQDLVSSQATTATEMAKRLQDAHLSSDAGQSTALAAVPEAQQQGLAHEALAREHSAALTQIGASQRDAAQAALVATAAVQDAQHLAAALKASGALDADRADALNQRKADTVDLVTQLKQRNISLAQGNREFGLAQGELGVKSDQIAADILKAKQEHRLDIKEFNLKRWVEHNKAKADRLKRKIEYDKIASREGIAAADRALRKAVHEDEQKNASKNGGLTPKQQADAREEVRNQYATIQTIKSLAMNKLYTKHQDEHRVRQDLIRAGYSDVQIDVAFDLARNNGKISGRGIRKAKLAGIPHPLRFWERYAPQQTNAGGN